MKHHTEADEDDLLDIEDMELCPMCGQNYITEDQAMCDECRGKTKGENGGSDKDWKDDDSLTSASSDVENDDEEDEEYNSGFSDIDGDEDSDEMFDNEDDLEDGSPIDFAMEEDDLDDAFDTVSPLDDDFETVEVPDGDDDDDDEEDEDDYDIGGDDLLGKKK